MFYANLFSSHICSYIMLFYIFFSIYMVYILNSFSYNVKRTLHIYSSIFILSYLWIYLKHTFLHNIIPCLSFNTCMFRKFGFFIRKTHKCRHTLCSDRALGTSFLPQRIALTISRKYMWIVNSILRNLQQLTSYTKNVHELPRMSTVILLNINSLAFKHALDF